MTQETKNFRQDKMMQAAQRRSPETPQTATPALRFTPYAWAKLLYLRDLADAEVGGFGLTAPDDLLLVIDVVIVKQTVSSVSVNFDDAAVADFFDAQVETGRRPEQFARIWVHTHPGNMPTPSRIDEKTFERVFGACDWAIMFIIDREGQTCARIRFNVGPGVQGELPVDVCYSRDFPGSDRKAWLDEYQSNVRCEECSFGMGRALAACDNCCAMYAELADDMEKLDPGDREFILEQCDNGCEEEEVIE